MKKIAVTPPKCAPTGGFYSHGIKLGDLLFCAGQVTVDPDTKTLVEGDIRVQTTRVLENIKLILADQNLGFANIVKATVFLKDMADFQAMNETYGTYFPKDVPLPARTTVQVAALPRGAAIEIEVIAHY